MQKRAKEQLGLELVADDGVLQFITDESFDTTYGARPIRRVIQTKVEDALADAYLDGTVKHGDTVTLQVEDKKIKFVTE